MISGVLFDLDGTLFDRALSVVEFVRSQHARHQSLLHAVSENDYVARFIELDARGYVNKEDVYAKLVAEYGLTANATEALFADFCARYHDYAVPFPDLESTLERLQGAGLRLGMITNGGASHQRATINALRVDHYFEAVLISESEGIRKPDPAIFELALERLGLDASEAVYVGDHPEVDVRGARDAGLWTVWKRDDYWRNCLDADAVIENLASLPGVIAALPASRLTQLARDEGPAIL